MTTSTEKSASTPAGGSAGSGAAQGATALASSQGKTVIADAVVSKIAGIAAREVNGVYALGGGAARLVGALRQSIGGSADPTQGISVDVGDKQTAVDIDIIAEYGVAITDLANGLRRNVISAIEHMTGLEVTEVNITVHDVHLGDEGPAPDSSEASNRS